MDAERPGIWFIAPNWVGDAVMSLPLLGLLCASGVSVRIFSQGYVGRIYWGLPGVDQLYVASKSGASRRILQRARLLRRAPTSGCIILPVSFSSALTAWLAGVPNRIGYGSDRRRLLLTRALATTDLRKKHLSEEYMDVGRALLHAIAGRPAGEFDTPRLRVTREDESEVDDALALAGAPLTGFSVVIPGATYGSTKSWPAERYRALVKRLVKDAPVVVAGAAKESGLAARVAADVGGAFNLAGRTSLGGLFALLKRATVLVANDSGAPHAAASLGTPVVVIFGSTSPTWTRPLGDGVRVVREPVHCAPCFRKTCPTQLECYGGIDVDRVFAETQAMMNDPRGPRVSQG